MPTAPLSPPASSPSSAPASDDLWPAVLIGESNPTVLAMLKARTEQMGYKALTATSLRDVSALLKTHNFSIDAMVIDHALGNLTPHMLAKNLRSGPDHRHAALMMTGDRLSIDTIRSAVQAGFSHCLDKSQLNLLFDPLLAAGLQEATARKNLAVEMQRQHKAFLCLETARFLFRTLEDAENLTLLISQAFPDPLRASVGLRQLMINAVEHGLAGIGYEEKTRLLRTRKWREEIMERLDRPQTINRYVEMLVQKKNDALYVQIKDPGPGFNWSAYLAIDPSRAGDGHGRGIAQAYAQAFDDMRYNPDGNQVTVMAHFRKEKTSRLEW